MLSHREELERIKELTFEHPTFFSKEHIENELIPGTILTTVIIVELFIVYFAVGRFVSPKRKTQLLYDVAYQAKNMTANIMLEVMGLYYYLHVLDRQGEPLRG